MIIAYDHAVEFIPPLNNEKKTSDVYRDVITLQERSLMYKPAKFSDELKFFNNQERDVSIYSNCIFTRTQDGQVWLFEVKGVVSFIWKSGSLYIEYIKHENFTVKLLEYWTLHITLPLFFTIEEKFDFLHAGAVEVEDKPILFVAESFGGKSTMTDFFIKQGYPMISDDKVAIFEENGEFFSVPSHHHLRAHRGIEDLGFVVENVAKNSKPIHAIYELEKSDANAEIVIEELYGIEKFKSLRSSSEINLSFLKAKRFIHLTHLAQVIPVYKVSVPWDMGRLSKVHDVIVEHITS